MPAQTKAESKRVTVAMLSPDAPVPKLRADLEVRIAESDTGDTIELVDAKADATHVLQDVEFSIARMLNGRRSATEVLAAAEKLGLPLNLESLSHFVAKLGRLNLLAAAATPSSEADAGRTFPQRKEWADSVRARYQDALRAFRQDNLAGARAELEKLLETDAENAEALALLKKLDEREAASEPEPFAQTWSSLETSWFEGGGAAAQEPDDVAEAFGARPSGSKRKLPIALVATAVVLLVLSLVPLPYAVSAPCTLKPRSVKAVAAPREGVIASVEVKEGEWVTAGKVLVRYEGAELTKRLAAVEEKLEAARKAKRPAASPATLKAASAGLEKARAELKKATAAAKKAKKAQQAAAAKKEAAARAAVEKATAALEALKAPADGPAPAVALLEAERTKLEGEKATLQVLAEADGEVAALTAKPGLAVLEKGALLRLEDTKTLVASAAPRGKDASAFAVDQRVTVTVGAKRLKGTVTGLRPEVTATVDNASATLRPGAAGELVLEGVTRSLVGRL